MSQSIISMAWNDPVREIPLQFLAWVGIHGHYVSGTEPVVVMHSFDQGKPIEHRFYHYAASIAAIDRWLEFEYKRGEPTWLEYREL